MLLTPLALIAIIALAVILGYFLHFQRSKKSIVSLQKDLMGLRKQQSQMQGEYDILLQAMEGAKAQAESLQRKIFGTNVFEVSEPADAEKILNREILTNFIFKKMVSSSAKSDVSAQPGDTQMLASLEKLDDRVVKILAQAVR